MVWNTKFSMSVFSNDVELTDFAVAKSNVLSVTPLKALSQIATVLLSTVNSLSVFCGKYLMSIVLSAE